MKYFVYLIILVVTASVVTGFFIVGSPKEQRLYRFDEQRISDLQTIQSEIINYWQGKEKLPAELSVLRDDIRGINIPKDPASGAEYIYEIRGSESFALCATFDRPSSSQSELKVPRPVEPYQAQNWEHEAGYVCFGRTIDKDLYRSGS